MSFEMLKIWKHKGTKAQMGGNVVEMCGNRIEISC